jgi:hypothetical protein
LFAQLALFCGYETTHDFIWENSPLNTANNVNGLVMVNRSNLYTLGSGHDSVAMLGIQKDMVGRIVGALEPYDNVLIELVFMTNETTITSEWGQEIVHAVATADPKRMMVVPAEWTAPLRSQLNLSNIVQSCGGSSKAVCTSASTDTYYRLPPPSLGERTLLDSGGPLAAAYNAVDGNKLAAFRNT